MMSHFLSNSAGAEENECAVFENVKCRNKCSKGHKYKSKSNKTSWVCSQLNCKGEIQTEGDAFSAYKKGHNGDCTNVYDAVDVHKRMVIERMKQRVLLGEDPRNAYDGEMLLCGDAAAEFWGYREVFGRLYSIRQHQGIPKLPECKEEISSHINGSNLRFNFQGSMLQGLDINNLDDGTSAEELEKQILQQMKTIQIAT